MLKHNLKLHFEKASFEYTSERSKITKKISDNEAFTLYLYNFWQTFLNTFKCHIIYFF